MPHAISEILLNREVIAIDQDKAGKQATRAWKSGDREVWTRPLAGGDTAVAFFNRGKDAGPIPIKWSDLGLTKSPTRARDLWAHQDVTLSGPAYTAEVASHDTLILRLK
jgi:alpha-galactosidase